MPRREDNAPKTIDQIHREVQQEELRKREAEQQQIAARQQMRAQEKGMRPVGECPVGVMVFHVDTVFAGI